VARSVRVSRRRQLSGPALGFAAAWLTVGAVTQASSSEQLIVDEQDVAQPGPPVVPFVREAAPPPPSFGVSPRPKLPPDAPVFDLDPRYLRYRMQYRDSVYSFFPGWCRRWRDICVTCTTTTGDDRICTHATPCGALSSTPWCEEFDLSRVPDLCRTWTDGTYRYDRTGRLGRERTRVAASIFCVDEFERKR
jgi:hypothetical protein